MSHTVVTRDEWVAKRKALLQDEKDFTRVREHLAAKRRDLPWVRLEKSYVFDGPNGKVPLAELFGSNNQLVIYHLMFAPDWERACKSCSFWADHFDGMLPHLNARDVSFAAISRAPMDMIDVFKKRQAWNFNWVSSGENSFNYDFDVSFTEEELESGGGTYNYVPRTMNSSDLPGISVFAKEGDAIYHTYSTFTRGIDMMNLTYQYLDLVPKGRDEQNDAGPMEWVRVKDEYAVA